MTISSYRTRTLTPLGNNFTAADLNAQLGVLQQNIALLSAVMSTAREGSALLGFNAPIEPGIGVGRPVYYNTTTHRFELSRLDLVASGTSYVAGPSSEVWGIVAKNCAADRANLLLDGVLAIDMTASTGSASPTGKWYLTDVAGSLSSTAGKVLVAPVLLGTGDGDILFRPWFADNYARFVPQVIPLAHAPAGTLNDSSTVSTISAVNLAIPGWLPAAHAVFNGLRPAGARFGYHWQVDPNLADIWPPVKPAESKLLIDMGKQNSRGYTIILGDDANRLQIDAGGIWWMTDRTGQLPWDLPPDQDPLSVVPGGGGFNPIDYPRRLRLEGSFAGGARSALEQVFSLTSAIPWLRFAKAGTETPATRGDLVLQLLASEWVKTIPIDTTGLAIKQLVNGQFTQGPVVTALVPGSPAITLSGVDVEGVGQSGVVTISVTASKDFDLLPLRTVLQNATDEEYQDTIGIGMRAGINSGFITEFHVPHSVPASSTIVFVLWLLAPQTMALPAGILASCRRLPSNPVTPTDLPIATNLTLNYNSGATVSAGKYILATTTPLTVSGGETLYFKIQRQGSTDAQAGRLDVLKTVGKFV